MAFLTNRWIRNSTPESSLLVTNQNLSSYRAHGISSVLYPSLLNLAIALQYHVGVEGANSSAEPPDAPSLVRHVPPFE